MVASTDLAAALNAAIQGGYVAHLTEQTYTISSPIVVRVTKTTQGALGIDGGGATLVSQVTDGSPLIKIVVDPGVDFRYLTLSNFNIEGNGREGSGIQIFADGNDQWVYSWNIDNVTVENTGGYGLDVRGSVFEGLVSNSWMNGNALGGAYFGHSSGGGQASALRWFGGGFKDNGGAGLTLGNGARDMSVDNALFLDNDGVGISAGSGITSVTGSHFQDNQGPGVWFQNYGNFNGNTFSTSGSQTVGISGYLAGGATLVDNASTYTGPGADTIALANLQGNGNAFVTGDDGPIITGTGVSRYGSADGAYADVLVSSAGVALPPLAAVTTATTAPVPSSTGTGVLETTLRAAVASGQVAHLADVTYTVTTPIVINVTSSTGGPIGIDLGGAKINSQITDGSPVVQINVGPGVDLASLTLSNFSIQGNGLEGDGIKIVANGTDRRIHDLAITNVNVEHVGGIGLDVLGNVSHGSVVNTWMHGNTQAGARFANSAGGGVVNDIDWMGGGFRKNGGAGLVLDNGARDVTLQGVYFVENSGPGLHATSGITLVEDSGFENNQGAGAIVLGSANFANSSFSTWGPQTVGVAGYLAGGKITLTGLGIEYYGGGANQTVLANVQGAGTLAATGGADIIVGPHVTVTGGQPYSPPSDATAPSLLSITASGTGISGGTGELGVGNTVTLSMAFDEAVIVTGGTPTLQLSDGGIATLVSGSGQSVLAFAHTVQAGQNAADLAVLSINLDGASIRDAAGNAATLSAAVNYNPAGILKVDTTSHVSVAALSTALPEGNAASTAFTFVVTLSAPPTSSQTVTWAVAGSGANPANGLDFSGGILPSGVLTFSAGETSKAVVVSVLGDAAPEPSEGFALTLSNPSSGLTIDTASATGTIVNDDAIVSVAALAAAKAEGNSGSTAFTFTVTRTGDTSGSATASYAVTGSGTSPANAADFTGGVLPSGTVSFAAGETTKTITLTVAGDSVVEASEAFTLTLSSPSAGLSIGTASATGTIQNDDASLSVAALAAVKAEGNSGSTAFTFTVTRTGDTSSSATASYAVTGSGTSPANAADFTGGVLPSGTVSFAAGETTRTIAVNVAGDTTVEATETFTITLSSPSGRTTGSTIGTASAAGSILNDDSAGSTQLIKAVNVGGGQVTASTGVVFQGDPGPTTGAAASRTFATKAAISGTTDDALYQDERWIPGGSYTYEVPVANGTYKVDLLLAEIYYGITGTGQRVFDMSIEGQALPALQNIDIFAKVGANAAFTISQQVTVSDGSLSIQVGPGSSAAGNVENAKLNAFAVYAVSAPPPVTLSIAAAAANPSSDPTIATASATGTIQNDDVVPPVAAHDDAYIVLQGQSLSANVSVLLNDENAASATPLGSAAHGTLNLTAGGTFSYTPAPGYFGLDSFSYHAGNAGNTDDAEALLYVVPVSTGPTTTLNLTALSVEQLVAATYVAFFGRAADAGGLDFWVDEFLHGMSNQSSAGLFADVASSFGVSGEAKALYPFLVHPFAATDIEIGSFLDTLYNNLFNRSADAAGLAYWTGQVRKTLAAGEFVGSVLIDVIGGAQDGAAAQDITTLMSKVAVSLHYTHKQQQHGTVWSGANDVTAATALLDAVTSDPHTLLMGIRNADTLIAMHG